MIDTKFNFYYDSNGKDPDGHSRKLQEYHKILWSKPLPNGKVWELKSSEDSNGYFFESEFGEFSSDAITHSYKGWIRYSTITNIIPNEVNELFDAGSTIGAYLIFPRNNSINKARGCLLNDRFDMTLECIRLFYLNKKSVLFDILLQNKNFFELFVRFENYVDFFLLQDLVDDKRNIKSWIEFDNVKKSPEFVEIKDKESYLAYKEKVMSFINQRNKRITEYAQLNF
ncbi:MAG: hypothetical protein LBP83_09435 [Dysgonamonadaceae bacterium]|jgi:hypothetical protein|nr:hypothetical protein [Dysgonamonadaceae bacterium]